MLKEFRKLKKAEDFVKRGNPNYNLVSFNSEKDFRDAIQESFRNPFFLFNHVFSQEGGNFDFFVVGEKENTQEISSSILEHPTEYSKIVQYLTGFECSRSLETQKVLIHFDTTRNPKKSVVRFRE